MYKLYYIIQQKSIFYFNFFHFFTPLYIFMYKLYYIIQQKLIFYKILQKKHPVKIFNLTECLFFLLFIKIFIYIILFDIFVYFFKFFYFLYLFIFNLFIKFYFVKICFCLLIFFYL